MTQDPHKAPGLRWERVARFLREKILEGVYRPGERMPRQHDLAREQQVSFNTLKQALDLLELEGYVVRRLGEGTYASLPEQHEPVALVIDDDQGIRELLAEALELSGWKSVAVESGQLALDELKERSFDLIFLDLVMPGMSGADTFREIRKLVPHSNVVIITAFPYSALLSEAMQAGPFSLLKKPFELDDLHQLLRNVADPRKSVGTRSR